MTNLDKLNALSSQIIKACIEVHSQLGPGLLEHCYQRALMVELAMRGMKTEMEVPIPFTYKGVIIDAPFRADIVVEDEIILELKATADNNEMYAKQLLTYLRLANKQLGLVLNFNRKLLKFGIERVINTTA